MLIRISRFFFHIGFIYISTVITLSGQSFSWPLLIPPLYEGDPDTANITRYELESLEYYHQFTFGGEYFATMGFNGMPYFGPTLLWKRHSHIQMYVHNHLLAGYTNFHLHGALVPPGANGSPHEAIAVDDHWEPIFEVKDKVSTLWYHPHLLTLTLPQINKGLAGLIIVTDDNDALQALLPHQYGVDDIPLIFQDKDLRYENLNDTCAMGTTLVVNGRQYPYLEVPAQQVRFRLLNAANQRVFALSLRDSLAASPATVKIIATDAGYTEKPLTTDHTVISSGERVEWVADFSGRAGQKMYLYQMPGLLDATSPGNPVPAAPWCYNNGHLHRVDSFPTPLLEIRITAPSANPVFTLPETLQPATRPNPDLAAAWRQKKLVVSGDSPSQFLIDHQPFQFNIINDTIRLGDIEIWEISNQTPIAHPFHIQNADFYILALFDSAGAPIPLPAWQQGPKDVVFIPGGQTARIVVQFINYASTIDPKKAYMYHAHGLTEADGGMMGQFVITDPTSITTLADADDNPWHIFPNPGRSQLSIQGECASESRLEIIDISGRSIGVFQIPVLDGNTFMLHLPPISSGINTVKWIRDDGVRTAKWINHR